MVFTSIPVYAEPQNWNQQQAPDTPTSVSKTGSASTNRPSSMTEQARMAKVPPPDPALPCPRCESTNTKFCYYNNYSLTQPRHFCKTCRRYWTRGGALRNVPVGGGLRRNKRSKSSSSKSTSSSATSAGVHRQVGTGNGTASSSGTAIANHNATHLPFFSPLHQMSHDYSTTNLPNLGLGFANMQPIDSLEYHQVENNNNNNNNNGLSIGLEPWRIPNPHTQNLPFLPGMYSLEGEGMMKLSAPGLITQFASVKMEDSNNMSSLNLPRAFLDNPGNDIYCAGGGGTGFSTSCEGNGGWTMDLAGFNSASIQSNIM